MLSLSRTVSRALAPRAAAFSAAAKKGQEASFDLPEVDLHRLDEGPKSSTTASKDELVSYFKDMALIRRLELASDEAYKSRQIRGFLHLYDGQEAVCVGVEAGLTYEDRLITAYRDHGFQYCRGSDTRAIMGEMMGKASGCSQGKGGSMHMYHFENNFFGGNGIVGAQVPVGAGLAFAQKFRNEKNITMAFYGDGAANQGQIYEAANMAYLWKLPIVFVTENNGYGMGTSASRSSMNTEYYKRGDVVPGLRVNGMNILSVRESARFAKEYCPENGPLFIEYVTYRYHGHSMSDPGTTYRTREEVAEVRATRDPIEQVRKMIIDNGMADAAELKAMEKAIRKDVAAGIKQAIADPEPEPKELYTDVYAGEKIPIRGTNLAEGFH